MKSFKVTISPKQGIEESTIASIRSKLVSEDRYVQSKVDIEVTELPPLPEVKKIETGVLNIVGMPDNFSVCDNGASFYNGDYVDLEHYPELKPLCTVSEDFDYLSINKKDKIIVELEGKFSSFDDKYLYFCNGKILKSQIKSIRIVEGAK